MTDNPKYACPKCGAAEFITAPNSYDLFEAVGDKLLWRKTESGDSDEDALFCRECGERAPSKFEAAAR